MEDEKVDSPLTKGEKTGLNPWQDEKGRFRKGTRPPNAGRRPGRHEATVLAQALIDGKSEAIINQVLERAEAGDPMCLKLVIDRIVPPRKSVPFKVDIKRIEGTADAKEAIADIIDAQCRGDITPDEAASVISSIKSLIEVSAVADLEARIAMLEPQS